MALSTPRRTPKPQPGDVIFGIILRLAALLGIGVLVAIVVVLILESRTSISTVGLGFLTGTNWDVPNSQYGAAPFIFQTIVTSILALVIATPLAVGSALFITEYAPRWIGTPLGFLIELLVTIPSVVFGLWALDVLGDQVRPVEVWLQHTFGKVPVIGALFGGAPFGLDTLTAGIVLAVMILPTILSISREVIRQVPRLQREGMLAMGATRWEAIRYAILPYARAGIIGSILLGLARAIGETMAVLMIGGGSSLSTLSASLFGAPSTIAARIASSAGESSLPGTLEFSSILELGLVLLIFASIFNIMARLLTRRILIVPGLSD
ncbi:MAG TPA: phosphate ABC transporter permease subunit PstC [Aggregatilineales bacterium]|nr:phosphate ABC transporter permease subunit PstC [Aggregatilineales bacterium]